MDLAWSVKDFEWPGGMAVVSKIYYCCEWLWTERPYV
jgi:hypothetical protein